MRKDVTRIGRETMLRGRYIWMPVIGLLTGFAAAQPSFAADQSQARTPRWRWRGGAVYRSDMEISVSGTSRTQQQVAGLIGPRRHAEHTRIGEPSPVGPNPDDISQYGDRDFDDGYVYRDPITGVPGVPDDHWTVNWGYQDADQYDPLAETLTFRRETVLEHVDIVEDRQNIRSVQTDRDTDMAAERRFGSAGIEIEFAMMLKQKPASGTEWTAGVRYFPEINTSLKDTTFRQTVIDREYTTRRTMVVVDHVTDTYTYEYPDQPLYPDPPDAPYDGSDADPPDDPLLENRPQQTERQVQRSRRLAQETRQTGQTEWHTANRVDLALQADLLQAVVGPRFGCRLGTRTYLHATVALVLNYLNMSVDRHEVFEAISADGQSSVMRCWYERERQTDWLWGGQLQLGAAVALGPSWSAGVSAGYEWIERTRIKIGPNQIALDLSSPTMAAFIGVTF